MKVRILFASLALGLFCGCAANAPYTETMTDTNTQTRQTYIPRGPAPVDRPTYQPGLDSGSGMMSPGGQ